MEDTFINIPNNTDTGTSQIATVTLTGETAQIQEISTVHSLIAGDTLDAITSISLSSHDVTANISYAEASPWTKDASGVFRIPEKAKSILIAPTAYTSAALTTRTNMEVVFVMVLLHEIDNVLVPFAYFSSPEEMPTLNTLNFQNLPDGTTGQVFLYNDLYHNYGVPPVMPTLGCPYGRLFLHKIATSPTAPVTTTITANLLFLDHFVGGMDFGSMLRGTEDIFFPSDILGDQ